MGTQAGAARAREIRTRRARERDAVAAALPSPASALTGELTSELMPSDRTDLVHDVSGNQTLDEKALAIAEPHAAGFILKVVSGLEKVSASVRLDASFRLLEGRGRLGSKSAAASADLGALDHLAKLVQMRTRAAGAVDAQPVDKSRNGGELVVNPEPAPDSGTTSGT